MKNIAVLLSLFTLIATSSLSAHAIKNNCGCNHCKCTEESNCGCYSDEGCNCTNGECSNPSK